MSNIFIENKTANINISASGDEGIPKISLGTSSNNRIQEVAFDLVSGNNLLCDSLIDLLEGSKILVRYGNSPGTILGVSDLALLKTGTFSESLTYNGGDTSVLNYYIDTVNGDDGIGDGSESNPFKTIPCVQRILPKRGNQFYVGSKINIFMNAPEATPAISINDMDIIYGPEGQLTFQGTNPIVVKNGPHTVSAYTALGTKGAGATIALAAPAWTASAEANRYIHVLTGANAGKFIGIQDNTTNTLFVGSSPALSIGDTFEIITPGNVINPSAELTIIGEDKFEAPQKSRLIFTNIVFGGSNFINVFSRNCFRVYFGVTTLSIMVINGDNPNINVFGAYDSTQLLNTNYVDTSSNCCCFTGYLLCSGLAHEIHRVTTPAIASYSGYSFINRCALQYVFIRSNRGVNVEIARGFFNSTGDAIIVNKTGNITVSNSYFYKCVNIINADAAQVHMETQEGTVGNISGFGIVLGPGTNFDFDGTLLSPAAGDVTWRVTSSTDSYPAVAGTGISDNYGSFVVKLS